MHFLSFRPTLFCATRTCLRRPNSVAVLVGGEGGGVGEIIHFLVVVVATPVAAAPPPPPPPPPRSQCSFSGDFESNNGVSACEMFIGKDATTIPTSVRSKAADPMTLCK